MRKKSFSPIAPIRLLKDKLAVSAMFLLSVATISLALLIGLGLYLRSAPILQEFSLWELLSSSAWRPMKGEFGFFPFIMGTLWVTGIAIVLALPLCLFTAIYLAEYASARIRALLLPIVNILAGIPPVIYGVWGIFFVVPLVQEWIAPYFVDFSTGYTMLSGGIVLAVMVFPLIVSLLVDVFLNIPPDLKNASLSLGATRWETTKKVVLRKARPAIMAALILAISRAFGETIAVLMVCGNVPIAPKSVFDPGYPLPALMANNFGEMLSVPLYDAALMLSAFILFVIIFLFNLISRVILNRVNTL